MTVKTIWMDGQLVDWGDATVHVTSFGLHYGIGFFEEFAAIRLRPGLPSSG